VKCPFCEDDGDKKVIDSRAVVLANRVRRRRECSGCGERFTTYELIESDLNELTRLKESLGLLKLLLDRVGG